MCLRQSKCLLCSKQLKPRASGQRNPAAEFFMIVSGHPAFVMPLPETCVDIFGLHPVGRKSCRLPFFQSWEEANLFMKESCPLLQAWKPSEGPNSSKGFLIDSLEILLTWKHTFRPKGPLSLKTPKYFFFSLSSCSFVLGVSAQCENNGRLSFPPLLSLK